MKSQLPKGLRCNAEKQSGEKVSNKSSEEGMKITIIMEMSGEIYYLIEQLKNWKSEYW